LTRNRLHASTSAKRVRNGAQARPSVAQNDGMQSTSYQQCHDGAQLAGGNLSRQFRRTHPHRVQHEGALTSLCEEEIAYWRSRPTMKSLRSLNTPMIDARNAIKEQLPLSPENSWLNPRTGEREHLARKYLNFSEQEWAAMHALTEDGRQQRLEGQLWGVSLRCSRKHFCGAA